MNKFQKGLSLCLLFGALMSASAQLSVHVEKSESVGNKAVVKLAMTNSFPVKIESARANVFLMDDKGKVVGQGANWVIGGTKDKPGLASKSGTVYNFVVPTERPFQTVRVNFSKVILDGGKSVDVPKNVQIQNQK